MPDCCLHCQKLGSLLCQDCRQAIEWYPFATNLNQNNGKKTPDLDSLHIACLYNPIAKSVLRQFKFQGVKAAGYFIAEMMYLALNFPLAEVIAPVPLNAKRQAGRGFNQSQIIAKKLAELTGIPCADLLIRTRLETSQVEKGSRTMRLKASIDQFKVKKLKKVPQSILLIDDVVTTGSTLRACAHVLKLAGVKNIHAAVFAHNE